MTSRSDFRAWTQENLAKFAKDANEDRNRLLAAGIKQANDNANTLRVLKNLMKEFDRICNENCKVPVRNAAYRQAMDVFK